MKYEVIGWTDNENDYPVHKWGTAPVRAAIIREIKKHGYLFGGDKHENLLPVLNDGTLVSYSWRGWGGVMAEAHGKEGDCSYMFAYMDSRIDPKLRKYPQVVDIDPALIVPKESLAETFEMHLTDEMFNAVKSGTKTVEVRLFDDKRKSVDIGDYIEFINLNGGERLKKRVIFLVLEESFEELFESRNYNENGEWVKQFKPEEFGSPAGTTAEEFEKAMYRHYDKEREKEFGVVAFVLDSPHAVKCEFVVSCDYLDCGALYAEALAAPDISEEERARLLKDGCDFFEVGRALREVDENFIGYRWSYYTYGANDKYNPEISLTARKTLKGLFGKEEKLKEISRRFCVVMRLKISVTLVKDCKDPAPSFTLDKDILEFLYKSGAELKIDYNVV